jgi:membrane-associated protease RseP (regulator of RpoE activity)
MKRFSIAVAGVLWGSTLAAAAAAQPILNRVEQLLRDQVDAASPSPQPAEPGYLGLIADDAGGGVRVLEVVPGTAADRAGLKKGDLITHINGQPVRIIDDMARALAGKPAGTQLAITAARDGAQQQLNVTLGRRAREPAAAPENLPAPTQPAGQAVATPRPRLGVRSVPVSEAVRLRNNLPSARGALIVSVIVDSPAERAQIPLGAIVTAVGETPIGTPQELAAAIAAVNTNDVELSYIYRGQSVRKKVALGANVAAGDRPKREVRGRPPLPEAPGPADAAPSDTSPPAAVGPNVPPLAVENPAPEQGARIEALERHVKQLEARIKTLEAELAGKKSPEGAAPN